jgi:hypothetical protein
VAAEVVEASVAAAEVEASVAAGAAAGAGAGAGAALPTEKRSAARKRFFVLALFSRNKWLLQKGPQSKQPRKWHSKKPHFSAWL